MRELAADSGNIIWTSHVRQRMLERDVDSTRVLEVPRKGDVDDAPEPAQKQGDWRVKVTLLQRTGRTAGVVTIVKQGNRLVLTVEWEDLK